MFKWLFGFKLIILTTINGIAMATSSPPILEAQLNPYTEEVVKSKPMHFYLLIRDIEIYNDQGNFNNLDWQLLLALSQRFKQEADNAITRHMLPTAKRLQTAEPTTFAQQTAIMITAIDQQTMEFYELMLQQAQDKLSSQGKALLATQIQPQGIEYETVTHWEKMAVANPQLLYNMYKPIFEHLLKNQN